MQQSLESKILTQVPRWVLDGSSILIDHSPVQSAWIHIVHPAIRCKSARVPRVRSIHKRRSERPEDVIQRRALNPTEPTRAPVCPNILHRGRKWDACNGLWIDQLFVTALSAIGWTELPFAGIGRSIGVGCVERHGRATWSIQHESEGDGDGQKARAKISQHHDGHGRKGLLSRGGWMLFWWKMWSSKKCVATAIAKAAQNPISR